jgi:3-oxoacyl-[acyl-carrier protein] reductase
MALAANRFTGRVAIVTGAGRGIGAATARRLAAEGAHVAAVDLDRAAADTVAREIVAAGGLSAGYACDVSVAAAVDATVAQVVRDGGRLDIVVNNAGLTRDHLLFKMTEDEWDDVIDVNLKSVFLMARAGQRHMVTAGTGAFVNVSSTSALGNRGQANYSAAKAGIQGLTATLALELGPYGIRVNAVAPGFVATSMTDAMAARLGSTPQAVQEGYAAAIALRRVGQPEDIAAVIAFLASDDAAYVSGQTIYVHGGGRL